MSANAPASDHLVHGMGKVLEPPAWPAINAGEAEAVLAHFPQAGRVIALPWHSPRPFSAAARVEAEGGTFILKRHHQTLRSVDGLTQEHRFMAHLRKGGVSVPEVMAQAGGDVGALGLGEWTYELHRASPGADLYRDRHSWTGFLSMDHARAAGHALARLHLAAQGYGASPRRADPLIASFTIVPAADWRGAAQAYIAARPALARYLRARDWQGELAWIFAQFGHGLCDRLAGQAALWTHNDWHPSNLLWSAQGEVATVFDFGLATQTCALHDLATAIERCAIPWLDLGNDAPMEGDVATALVLVQAYCEIAPLSTSDLVTLLDLLPLVHIEFAMSEVDYFAGILKDEAQASMAWDDYLIGHARWFGSDNGKSFLRQLREGMGL